MKPARAAEPSSTPAPGADDRASRATPPAPATPAARGGARRSDEPSPAPRADAGLRFASTAVRAWTRVYTWRMPPPLRDARRREIESDLWEFEQDALARMRAGDDAREPPQGGVVIPLPGAARGGADLNPAAHVLARLLLGMPHDLSWRIEHVADRDRVSARLVMLGAVTAMIVAAGWWVLPLLRASALPKPAPLAAFMRAPAPPPPPPPPPRPPCRPPAFTTGCGP